jgi:hypothetical protein
MWASTDWRTSRNLLRSCAAGFRCFRLVGTSCRARELLRISLFARCPLEIKIASSIAAMEC